MIGSKTLQSAALVAGLAFGAVEALATTFNADPVPCPSLETIEVTYDSSTNTLTVTVKNADGSTDKTSGGTTTAERVNDFETTG